MIENMSSSSAELAVSSAWARIALAAGILALISLAALHILSPEIDPSWRMVSEYALGDYGIVLSLMFLAWALTGFAVFLVVRSQVHSIGGTIGLAFLVACVVGTGMAAFFDVRHPLHSVASLIGIPTLSGLADR